MFVSDEILNAGERRENLQNYASYYVYYRLSYLNEQQIALPCSEKDQVEQNLDRKMSSHRQLEIEPIRSCL